MTGGQDVLREALDKALYLAVSTLAFHGRDRGTPRQDQMLDGLEVVAQEADPMIRAALAALSAQRDTSGAVGSSTMPNDETRAREVLAKHLRPVNKGASWNVLEAKDDDYWLPIIRAMLAFAQPTPAAASAREGMREAISVTDDLVQYIQRWGGSCRDCADEDGFCPRSGIGCGESGKAIRWVLGALNYGLRHGYITAREAAGVDGVASVVVPRAWAEFVYGISPWEGDDSIWFGDAHPTMRGQFWWRKALGEALLAAAPTALPAGEDRHG